MRFYFDTLIKVRFTSQSGTIFNSLTLFRKKYLLSRDDLQLDWRPLYDLVMRTVEKSKSEIGMYRYFSSFELTLFTTIRECKV